MFRFFKHDRNSTVRTYLYMCSAIQFTGKTEIFSIINFYADEVSIGWFLYVCVYVLVRIAFTT